MYSLHVGSSLSDCSDPLLLLATGTSRAPFLAPVWPTHPAWGYFGNVQIIRYHARSGAVEHQEIFLGVWKIFSECSQIFERMGLLLGGGVGCLKFKIKFCCDQET